MNIEISRSLHLLQSLILFGLSLSLGIWSEIVTAQTKPVIYLSQELEISDSDKGLESYDQIRTFEEVVKDAEKLEGLFTIYRSQDSEKVYLEIKPEQLNKNFLCVVTLNSGLGQAPLLRGMPLQDVMFYFQRVQDNLHFVVRNVNFRTEAGDPLQRSLDSSFSDSVLYSLAIKSIHPTRQTLLISLNDLLMSEQDLSQLNAYLPIFLDSSYTKDQSKSYYGETKAFPLNMEIESVYGFKSDNPSVSIPSLADSRGFYLRVRYSFSEIPIHNGYQVAHR